MNANNPAAMSDEAVSAAIEQATAYILGGVGTMNPGIAIGAMVCAIEHIACSGGQACAMSVAKMLDESAANLRSASIAGGAPQIEVAS